MHVTSTALIWNLVAATGTVFSLSVLAEYINARAGARDPKHIPDPNDRAVAMELVRDYIIAEANRLASHAVSLILGIWSLFIPPQPPRAAPLPTPLAVFGLAVVIGIILINALTTANSTRAWLVWRRRYDRVAHGKRRGGRRS